MSLTNRERDVVDLLTVFGLSNRQIGIALSLKTDTVRYYLQHVMDKLGLHKAPGCSEVETLKERTNEHASLMVVVLVSVRYGHLYVEAGLLPRYWP